MHEINLVNKDTDLFYESVYSQMDVKAENLLGISPTLHPKLESSESAIDLL